MFVRKKKNPSGKISVQVIDKSSGKYRVIHTAGNSADKEEINNLVKTAKSWITDRESTLELDFSNEKEQMELMLNSITELKRVGYDLLLGRIFDEIGFNQIKDDLFKDLVIARIAFPKSKLKTKDYLYRFKQVHYDEDQIYRYLDKLHDKQKELAQQISFEHTKKILNQDISVVFYDVTTLYFEIDQEDELRKTGFSKEGKHQNPQIVLGLLVSKHGYPLAYEIFEGNKFEGHTMLPVVDAFKMKYNLDKLIIIADSGLLSRSNIDNLQDKGYEFILGARIKNETQDVKDKILALDLNHGDSAVINKGALKLIITYSEDRAKKDRYNREKGLRRLEKQIRRGKLTKSNINNRSYNKFLKLEGEITVAIDTEKLRQDARWDGLKGYLSNTKLPKEQIIENYQHLWKIEYAFRIAKTDLKIRPIYHRLQKRIEAHICISFVAYKVFKELERQLKAKKATISANKAIEIAENIHEITFELPSGSKISKLLLLMQEQKYFASLIKI
ncbi:IS1634 family transposase [Salinimicrobium marinum]|uniref:IS1634 family transposase n=1 Tax=Salinimicrobium marinum TaxID=680283 RepID=A0A918SK55_9FLAO|nr:IS1634 family transposase [Salinimicrobium marinum]GHA49199.1 IS1634 family transposase [Salinimicrobium marinum]